MKLPNRTTKVLLFLCIAWLPALAQHPFQTFDQFDRACGLTEILATMVQDDDGFLWLSSRNGLFRFDGVQAFKIDYLPSDTLPDMAKYIHMLSWDHKNQLLWVATETGVFKYSPHTGKSEYLQARDLFEQKDIIMAPAHVIYTDRQGETWASFGMYGLTHFIDQGKKVENFLLPLSEKEKAAGLDWRLSNSIADIQQDVNDDNILWIGTRRGLLKFSKAEKRLERHFYPATNGLFLNDANGLMSLYAHSSGKIYCATWNAGMLVYDPATEVFTPFSPVGEIWTGAPESNHIACILPDDNNGNLWVSGTHGLSYFDVVKEKFSFTIPGHEMFLNFKDRDANYWQILGGLRLFHKMKNQQRQHSIPASVTCSSQINGLTLDTVSREVFFRRFCQDGMFSFNVDKLSWKRYPIPGYAGKDMLISSFSKTPAGFLVLDDKRNFYLRPNGSDSFQLLPIKISPSAGFLTQKCRADGHLFITGNEGYLYWFKPGTWEPLVYTKNHINEPLPEHFGCATSSEFDQMGRLWIKTCEGFSIFVPEENRFIHVPIKFDRKRHLRQYNDFKKDARNDKKMWAMGSNGMGWFDIMNPTAGLQQRFDESNGFPYTNPFIRFFRNGKLWITTDQGLVEFNPESGKHHLFEHIKSKLILNIGDGRILVFWGDSYDIFQLDSLRQNEEHPKAFVSWFKVFEKPHPIPGSLFSPNKIDLKPDENFFSIGFSALAFLNPQNIKFAYQLQGLNDDWIYPEPGKYYISYTNIAGGDYTFKIKVTNSRGEWMEEEPYSLRIHVGTPWYKTTWAWLLYLLALAFAIYGAYLFQKRRWKMDADLKAKSQEAQRLAELDDFKSRFFTNITHEFRTPLTVILGMAEEMQHEIGNMKTSFGSSYGNQFQSLSSNSATISRNAHQLLCLVNQMLDLARVESGNFVLRNEQADVMQFLKSCVGVFQSLVFSKKQNLSCLTEPDHLIMDFDSNYLQKIVGNLISNALKFTPESGSITVIAKKADETLEIVVQDNGIGIDPKYQPHIFDRFYQVGNHFNEGTGIGLALVKELVQYIGGSISVQSKVGEGSQFTIVLPITNQSPMGVGMAIAQIPFYERPTDELVEDLPADLPVLLYVEDHSDLLAHVQNILRGSYHVIIARNGHVGLAKAIEHVPDIILSDVMMPNMDGFELCRQIKADLRTSHIPVLLLTAKATVQDKIEGLQHGADAYLMKPFQREELLASLTGLLENRRRLVAYLASIGKLKEAPPEVAIEHEFLQKIRQAIDNTLSDETYDMARLSTDMAMSRMQIYRKLTALTGHSASRFIRSHRLQKAKILLETTSLNVSEIAYQTGFSDHAWFSKCFKEEFGVTPSEIRK